MVVQLLAAAALLAAGGDRLPTVCPLAQRLLPWGSRLCAVDHPTKVMLCSTPKAAATTISAVVVLGLANETARYARQTAASRSSRHRSGLGADINRFRTEREHTHPALAAVPHDILKTCARAGWLCALIVRNPADRVISSFLHVALGGLGLKWPELVETVGNERLRTLSHGLRDHVRALELTARAQNKEGRSRVQRHADGHYLPQTAKWFDDLYHPRAKDQAHLSASLLKLITVDDVAGGLGAVDAEFRGGTLGLRAMAEGLHSRHWRSSRAPSSPRPKSPTNGSGSAAGASRAPRDAADDTHSPPSAAAPAAATAPGPAVLDADTPVYQLCGHLKPPLGRRTCSMVSNAYGMMQAANPSIWKRVGCLFDSDFELYACACDQRWLRSACPSCVAKACAASSS
jgi:hypothetical protein